MVIGETDAKSTFNIGTAAAVPTEGNFWVDGALTRDWSNAGNWSERAAPTADQEVIFTDVDAGGTNFVDQDFTIASLHYSAAGDQTTDLSDGSILAGHRRNQHRLRQPARPRDPGDHRSHGCDRASQRAQCRGQRDRCPAR